MGKKIKKPLILLTFLMVMFLFCSCTVQKCKLFPNYEKIGESATKNIENLREIDYKYAQIHCIF